MRKVTLSKEELQRIAQKDTVRRKLQGFLTHDYHQRSKVVLEGQTVEGLVFKEWSDKREGTSCLVLFSPSKVVNANPDILLGIGDKLLAFSREEKPQKSEKRLQKAIKDRMFEASYMEIPERFSDGNLVYLSKLEKPLHLLSNEGPGAYFFFINPSNSKEIIFVPDFLIRECVEAANPPKGE